MFPLAALQMLTSNNLISLLPPPTTYTDPLNYDYNLIY